MTGYKGFFPFVVTKNRGGVSVVGVVSMYVNAFSLAIACLPPKKFLFT